MNNKTNSLINTLLTIFIFIVLWPLIGPLIILVLLAITIFIVYIRFKLKKINKEYYKEDINDDEYHSFEKVNRVNDNDIIDVEYTERED